MLSKTTLSVNPAVEEEYKYKLLLVLKIKNFLFNGGIN